MTDHTLPHRDYSKNPSDPGLATSSETGVRGGGKRRHSGSALEEGAALQGRLGSVLMASLWLALAWAPLPLGSNRWWAVGFLAVWVWATLALAVGGLLWARQWPAAVAGGLHRAWPWLLPLAGLALLPAVQLLRSNGSVDFYQTHIYLLTTLVYLGAGLLVVLLCTTAARVKSTLLVLVLSALLQAVLAILLFSSRAHYALFFYEFSQTSRATGTFPNPDHLAGYMEMGLAAGLGLMFALMAPTKNETNPPRKGAGAAGQRHLREVMDFVMSSKMILRLGLVVMVIALVMTHSRMGNAAFFAAILLMGAALAVQSPRMRKPALWLVASVLVIDMVVIGQWVGLEKVMSRLQDTEISNNKASDAESGLALLAPPMGGGSQETLQERLRAPRLTLNLVAERPLDGFGGGTFFTVFPQYKTPDMPWYWPHTHNDYLEVAADLGLPGMVLFMALGALSLARAWPRLKDEASSLERGVAVATVVALGALGLHSLVDFNLHIPANALTLTALVSLAWASGASARQALGRSRSKGTARQATELGGGTREDKEPTGAGTDNDGLRAKPEQPGMD